MKRAAPEQPSLFAAASLAGSPTTREIGPGVFVHHHPGWMEPSVASDLFDRLAWCTTWEHRKIGGPSGSMLPRLTAWYGDPGASYRYSGIDNYPTPWTGDLEALRGRVASAVDAVLILDRNMASFAPWIPNATLLNLYRIGMDSVGFHSDNEAALGLNVANVVVASVSLGASRRFVLRKLDGTRFVFSLGHGDLFVMGPGVQVLCDHAIPKDHDITDVRISVTFRRVHVKR